MDDELLTNMNIVQQVGNEYFTRNYF